VLVAGEGRLLLRTDRVDVAGLRQRRQADLKLARALEPFRDLSIASLADRAGTGLGLPLTKALVEANRASLSIKSAHGEGTVMTVTIPPTRVLSE